MTLTGVVDGELKVYGTSNLRICDASVFPISLGTHLQSTIYAIAEKVSLFKSKSRFFSDSKKLANNIRANR